MNGQKPNVTLSLTTDQHLRLRLHLFSGDDMESAAILLCRHRAGSHRHRLLVREIHEIPHEACSQRSAVSNTWNTDLIASLLDRAEVEGFSVLKIHSHPSGYPGFSTTDDIADRRLLPAIHGWVERDMPHGSVVMLPDGQMFGRVIWGDGEFQPIMCISVPGPDIHFWYADNDSMTPADFTASHAQAFGQGTTDRLRRLSFAIVGCSGTGSPVIEQLARLGAGHLVLVDDDHTEERNVNRLMNATMADARDRRPKVEVLADAVWRMGLGTEVAVFERNLWDRDVVKAVAECDVLFGCMDTASGRFLLNMIASYYTLPYFDLGVRLDAIPEKRGRGQIREVCGTVHYLQPGRSSLMSRGLISMESVREEGLQRHDPTAHAQQIQDGYIRGAQEDRPAVISVNMFIASLAVNDLLARIHPYREMPNVDIASIEFSLSSLEFYPDPESEPCEILHDTVGRGDVEPLLDLVDLSERVGG
ncbi:MAG: ThiF family adenylyltransferase [Gammaproteobacteria bacterium]|nr:ThiF family adenylyltransferase [Gammaproteobacteria bacterium]